MNLQLMDADTAETVAGSSGCCVAPLSSSGGQSTSTVQDYLDSRKEDDHAALDCPV
jgi:hypothetical protein